MIFFMNMSNFFFQLNHFQDFIVCERKKERSIYVFIIISVFGLLPRMSLFFSLFFIF